MMGDSTVTAGGPSMADLNEDPSAHREPPKFQQQQQQRMPFHSQFDVLHGQHQAQHQQQHQPQQSFGQFSNSPYNMAGMAGALPTPANPSNMPNRPLYDHEPSPTVVSSTGSRQGPPSMYRGLQIDPHALRAAQQQQQYLASVQQYGGDPTHASMQHRSHMSSSQHQDQFSQMYHPYGLGALQYSPIGFPPPAGANMAGSLGGDMPDMGRSNESRLMPGQIAHSTGSSYMRRASEPAPVPSFPRGPPRKPKQSGHALWVGNLPPAATVTDLKDHFSRDATKDIESLFLISKSNCAFVNYRTEAACVAAMNRFHDSRFHGVRLVCRLRRGSTSNTTSPTVTELSRVPTSNESLEKASSEQSNEDTTSPVIVGKGTLEDHDADAGAAPHSGPAGGKVSEKYFIVKSLTVQDLEASVRNGIWATQSHNESTLNKAYDEAENVYLIFSANKSGEYFGYARMASPISGEPVNLSSVVETEDDKLAGTPQSIPTPATDTAPMGRIIDDSARGTIFWEAEHSDQDADESPSKEGSTSSSQNWGRQFKIEWISTSRLPFFRTRGLRNPWNADREVKIARDGTELEPNVGKRLLQMFHRPPPPQSHGPMSAPDVSIPPSSMPAFR